MKKLEENNGKGWFSDWFSRDDTNCSKFKKNLESIKISVNSMIPPIPNIKEIENNLGKTDKTSVKILDDKEISGERDHNLDEFFNYVGYENIRTLEEKEK